MKHAFLSPSASHRWLKCPGSAKANSDKPYEESEAALEGTSAHALLEVCLRLGSDPERFLGRSLGKGLMVVDDKMVTGVGYVIDWVNGYLAQYPEAVLRVEHALHAGPLVGIGEDVLWGTTDVIIDNYPIECIVLDYKHGTWKVEAKGNTQTLLYHAGQRHAKQKRYRRYRSVIVQPNTRGTKPVREHSVNDNQLMAWLEETVKPAALSALSDDPPRLAGEWCRYCYASGKCKAQAKQATDAAIVEFKRHDPNKLKPADRAALLAQVPMVKVFLEDFLASTLDALQRGESIPGYELGWNPPRRIWKDPSLADKLLGKLGLSVDERQPRELLSPAQAEKALRGKKLWPRKAKGQKEAPNPLASLLDFTEKTPCIEKASAANEFADNEA